MAILSFHYLLIGFLSLQFIDGAAGISLLARIQRDASARSSRTKMDLLHSLPITAEAVFASLTPSSNKTQSAGPSAMPSLSRKKRRRSGQYPEFTDFPLKHNTDVVVPPLPPYWPDPELDPKAKDLDQEKLMLLMGENFNRNYMSIEEPADSIAYPDGTLQYKFRRNQTPEGQDIPAEIKALEGDEIQLAKDGAVLKLKFSRRTRQKLQKFLWAYSYCPVRYRWKQLNVRYWPRWVKVGECDNARSCSIPAGMTCQPSEKIYVKILRFICTMEGSTNKRVCSWRTMILPILSGCSCSCR